MYQKKNTQFARRLMLTVSLLLMCIILMVGVTWARYQAKKNSYLSYNTREPAAISLWSGYDEATGTLTEGNVTWTLSNGVGTAHFYISNGTSTMEYSDEDVSATIRLLASQRATNAQVVMYVSDGSSTTTWPATPVQIKEGTPLYDTFGGGNAYVFLEEDGSELSWKLEGGTLSVLSVQIDVRNLEQIDDAALLQLQVVGK